MPAVAEIIKPTYTVHTIGTPGLVLPSNIVEVPDTDLSAAFAKAFGYMDAPATLETSVNAVVLTGIPVLPSLQMLFNAHGILPLRAEGDEYFYNNKNRFDPWDFSRAARLISRYGPAFAENFYTGKPEHKHLVNEWVQETAQVMGKIQACYLNYNIYIDFCHVRYPSNMALHARKNYRDWRSEIHFDGGRFPHTVSRNAFMDEKGRIQLQYKQEESFFMLWTQSGKGTILAADSDIRSHWGSGAANYRDWNKIEMAKKDHFNLYQVPEGAIVFMRLSHNPERKPIGHMCPFDDGDPNRLLVFNKLTMVAPAQTFPFGTVPPYDL